MSYHPLTGLRIKKKKTSDAVLDYQFSKRLELKIDGSTPTYVNFDHTELDSILVSSAKHWSSSIVKIHNILFTIRFVDAAPSLANFGGGAALTNGIFIGYTLYDGFRNELFSNNVILDNADLYSIFHKVESYQKQAGNINVIKGYFRFFEPLVLDVGRGDTFWALVQDNIAASPAYDSITDLNMRIQGTAKYLRVRFK